MSVDGAKKRDKESGMVRLRLCLNEGALRFWSLCVILSVAFCHFAEIKRIVGAYA